MVIAIEERSCRECGCVDDDCYCCYEHTGGPCWWIERDLCSACAEGKEVCPGEPEDVP